MSDIVFLDTETLGLRLDSPIWEIAAIRRDSAGEETALHMFVHHDTYPWYAELPDEFQKDYDKRFDGSNAQELFDAAHLIHAFLADRPHIIGAVPNFDTERISHQLLHPAGLGDPWHYHLIDIENLIVGWLRGHYVAAGQDMPIMPPWKSDELSRAVGINPDDFERHTAMGDVLWTMAQWDSVMEAGLK